MDAPELMEWIAFEMTNDPKYKEKLDRSIALEASAKKTAEQRADDIKKMFITIT